jgi:hypothetical protein
MGKTRSETEMCLIHEWLKRPEVKRTVEDVPIFYDELVRQGSSLLTFECRGDKCESLKSLLHGYILEARKLTG